MIKPLKIIGAAAIVLSLALGVVITQAAYRVDLQFNPIASIIRAHVGPWGEMIVLTSRPFSIGAERMSVVAALTRAGFVRTPNENIWIQYEGEIREGYELYQREGNDLACAIQFYVFVKFDLNGKLLSAKATEHEHGCL